MAETETSEPTLPPAGVVITVNGRKVQTQRAVLPYEDILRLADIGPLASGRRVVEVKYPATTLLADVGVGPGSYAMVRAGMVVTVGLARAE